MEMTTTNTGYRVTLRSSLEDKMLFTINKLKEEVNEGRHKMKKVKELKKLYKKFVILFGVKIGGSTPAFAATATAVATQTITPAIIIHWGIVLASLVVSIGLALSMSLLGIAGIYRMFRRRDEATEWSTDIVRGLVQVLVAVPITYIVFYLAQCIFKNLPALSGLF